VGAQAGEGPSGHIPVCRVGCERCVPVLPGPRTCIGRVLHAARRRITRPPPPLCVPPDPTADPPLVPRLNWTGLDWITRTNRPAQPGGGYPRQAVPLTTSRNWLPGLVRGALNKCLIFLSVSGTAVPTVKVKGSLRAACALSSLLRDTQATSLSASSDSRLTPRNLPRTGEETERMVANVLFRMGSAAIAFTNKPSACARMKGDEGLRGRVIIQGEEI
jgi:hypothetical protein